MQFPERELELIQLAQDMSRGLAEHPEAYPAPPWSPEEIHDVLSAYNDAREARREARAGLQAGAKAKKDALKTLRRMLRHSVKYVQCVAQVDAARLALVGWAPRRKPTRPHLEVPGAAGPLSVREEGPTWVVLAWEAPANGDPVAAFRIERRQRSAGEWVTVGSCVEPTIRLDDQVPGVELEYRVSAFNKAGDGPPSNSVRVVL